MPSHVRNITFDCRDPHLLAGFWAAALGFVDDPENPNDPGDPEALVVDPTGRRPGLQFIPVPEGKTAKNRQHFDLRALGDLQAEVARLTELGAVRVGSDGLADKVYQLWNRNPVTVTSAFLRTRRAGPAAPSRRAY